MKPFIPINDSNSETVQYKLPKLDSEHERVVRKDLAKIHTVFEEFVTDENYFFEPVNYSLNAYGYRTHDTVPERYILACGCSHTYGTGLHEAERYTNLLEKEIGMPVINTGFPGVGINFLLLNILRLINSDYPNPDAIICQYPNTERLTLPRTRDKLLNVLPIHKKYEGMFLDDSVRTHSEMCYDLIVSTLKNNKIKLVDFYYFYSVGANRINFVDYARDCEHPGPRTNVNVKNYILENL